MNVSKSTIEKLTITDLEHFDAIAVMIEPYTPTSGKVTITQFNKAWSYYWSHAGRPIKEFFLKCDKGYLIDKFCPFLREEIDDDDEDGLWPVLKKEILRKRKEGGITKRQARDLWDDAIGVDCWSRERLFSEVFGDEFWYRYPKKSNPEYAHMKKLLGHVQAAIKQDLEAQSA
jgi:hypothetical protein